MPTKTRGKAGLAVGFDTDVNRNAFGAMYWLKTNAGSKERVAEMLSNMRGRSWQIENFKNDFERHHKVWAQFRKDYADVVVLTGNKSGNQHCNGYGSKVYGYTVDCFAVSGLTKEQSREQNRLHRIDRETQQVPMESFVGISYDALSKRFAHRLYVDDMPKFDYKPSDFDFDEMAKLAKQQEKAREASATVLNRARTVASCITTLYDEQENLDMSWFDPEHIRSFVLEKQKQTMARLENAKQSFANNMETLDVAVEELNEVGGVLSIDSMNTEYCPEREQHLHSIPQTIRLSNHTRAIENDEATKQAFKGLIALLNSMMPKDADYIKGELE